MLNGILLLNKPQGFTSHDAVAKLRGILRQRKIGHAGTLDPMAEGVLIMLLGVATGAERWASASDKTYEATLRLGITTTTLDTSGEITSVFEGELPCARRVDEVISSFVGKQQQMPPMYSALSVGGKRLYDLARKGVEIERKSRDIEIHSITPLPPLEGQLETDYRFTVKCSKGTYIRSLCHDIGQTLGCGGTMSALVRQSSGAFSLDNAITFAKAEELVASASIESVIYPVESVFTHLPSLTLTEQGALRCKNGAVIFPQQTIEGILPPKDSLCRVYHEDGSFLMVGKIDLLDKGGLGVFCEKTFWSR